MVPTALLDLLAGPVGARAARVMNAMMMIANLGIAALQRAAQQMRREHGMRKLILVPRLASAGAHLMGANL